MIGTFSVYHKFLIIVWIIRQFFIMFCFTLTMESVSVNQNMKNPPLRVGVITPPDEFYKPVLYSDRVAGAMFNKIDHDIYYSAQNAKKLNEKKTPTSVYVALGLTALAVSFPFVKKYFK